jgi:hypothetical protein
MGVRAFRDLVAADVHKTTAQPLAATKAHNEPGHPEGFLEPQMNADASRRTPKQRFLWIIRESRAVCGKASGARFLRDARKICVHLR